MFLVVALETLDKVLLRADFHFLEFASCPASLFGLALVACLDHVAIASEAGALGRDQTSFKDWSRVTLVLVTTEGHRNELQKRL